MTILAVKRLPKSSRRRAIRRITGLILIAFLMVLFCQAHPASADLQGPLAHPEQVCLIQAEAPALVPSVEPAYVTYASLFDRTAVQASLPSLITVSGQPGARVGCPHPFRITGSSLRLHQQLRNYRI